MHEHEAHQRQDDYFIKFLPDGKLFLSQCSASLASEHLPDCSNVFASGFEPKMYEEPYKGSKLASKQLSKT